MLMVTVVMMMEIFGVIDQRHQFVHGLQCVNKLCEGDQRSCKDSHHSVRKRAPLADAALLSPAVCNVRTPVDAIRDLHHQPSLLW